MDSVNNKAVILTEGKV